MYTNFSRSSCFNQDVIRDILESNGTLNHVKARLRADVFAALQVVAICTSPSFVLCPHALLRTTSSLVPLLQPKTLLSMSSSESTSTFPPNLMHHRMQCCDFTQWPHVPRIQRPVPFSRRPLLRSWDAAAGARPRVRPEPTKVHSCLCGRLVSLFSVSLLSV